MEKRDQVQEETAVAVGCPAETAMAGKAGVCQGCPGRELCLRQGVVDPDQSLIDVRMNAIKHRIIVLSGKGGVGKSSISAALSMALAQVSGMKVGLVDLDVCGPSIPKLMGVDGAPIVNSPYGWKPLQSAHGGVKVMSVGSLLQEADSAVVWRGPRKTAIIKRFLKDTFWGRLDYLIFDTPPGTSDEHLTIVKALMNARPEGAIVVTTPQEVALATIRKELNFCRKMGLEVIGVLENMSGFTCPCCEEHWPVFPEGKGGGVRRLAEEFDVPFLGQVPLDPQLMVCCEEGRSLFHEHSDSPAARALQTLANRIHVHRTTA